MGGHRRLGLASVHLDFFFFSFGFILILVSITSANTLLAYFILESIIMAYHGLRRISVSGRHSMTSRTAPVRRLLLSRRWTRSICTCTDCDCLSWRLCTEVQIKTPCTVCRLLPRAFVVCGCVYTNWKEGATCTALLDPEGAEVASWASQLSTF